jgi:hypothetical protein
MPLYHLKRLISWSGALVRAIDSSGSPNDPESEDDDLIFKPEGEVGRPGLGGYNFLDWPIKKYQRLRVTAYLHERVLQQVF